MKVEVLKKFFALVCFGIIAFSLAVIGFAHPGGTDESGGHYNRSTGEYHYHHGYAEHQHPNGVCPYDYNDNTDTVEKGLLPNSTYIDKENLENVLKKEFGGEFGEEIRDAIVYASNTELLEINLTYYVEYDSLRDTALRQYGENVTERIFSHPDLIILTPEDIMDTHQLDVHEDDKNNEDSKLNLSELFNEAIDWIKNIGIALIVMFLPGFLVEVVKCLRGRFFNKKK